MDSLKSEYARLKQFSYQPSISEIQNSITQLRRIREEYASGGQAQPQLAKAKQDVKKTFDVENKNLTDLNNGLKKYGKALDKVSTERTLNLHTTKT